MINYKGINIKKYEATEGRNFSDSERERLIRKIIKLSGRLGWKYSQTELIGKSFRVIESVTNGEPDKLQRESVTMEFVWKSSKYK